VESASAAPEMQKGHALRGSSSSLSAFACETLVLPWHGSHWVEETLLYSSAASEGVGSWAQDFVGRIAARPGDVTCLLLAVSAVPLSTSLTSKG